jgi:uncharacterized FlgJ-related protein
MLYRFDSKNLTFKKAYFELFLMLFSIPAMVCCLTSVYWLQRENKRVVFTQEEQSQIIIKEQLQSNVFSRERLVEYLKELNVKYPEIVVAQSEIETGHYSSNIFKENHNLFGLKEAKLRPTTAKGTNNNHAFYFSWRESCQDYALFQAAYLKNVKSEDEYLQYLKQNYAQDSSYINKIKIILKMKPIK